MATWKDRISTIKTRDATPSTGSKKPHPKSQEPEQTDITEDSTPTMGFKKPHLKSQEPDHSLEAMFARYEPHEAKQR